MAKITDHDTAVTLSDLLTLRRDGWKIPDSDEDLITGIAEVVDTIPTGGTGDMEVDNFWTNGKMTIDIEVDAGGIVTFALRARCECGNPETLCHPEA